MKAEIDLTVLDVIRDDLQPKWLGMPTNCSDPCEDVAKDFFGTVGNLVKDVGNLVKDVLQKRKKDVYWILCSYSRNLRSNDTM